MTFHTTWIGQVANWQYFHDPCFCEPMRVQPACSRGNAACHKFPSSPTLATPIREARKKGLAFPEVLCLQISKSGPRSHRAPCVRASGELSRSARERSGARLAAPPADGGGAIRPRLKRGGGAAPSSAVLRVGSRFRDLTSDERRLAMLSRCTGLRVRFPDVSPDNRSVLEETIVLMSHRENTQ